MKFTLALFASYAAMAAAALWPEDMLQPRHHIGGQGGTPFFSIGGEGVTVDKIRVFRKGRNLIGLKTWFSDGGISMYGVEENESQEYAFDTTRNEVIKKMSLWGNGKGTRTGCIFFETSTGGVFEFGERATNEYPMEVGSGILVGWSGNADYQVDKLAPIFLKPMLKVYYDNVSYPDFDNQSGLRLDSIDVQHYKYNGRKMETSFKGKRESAASASWTVTSGTTLGFGASFTAGIPEVAQAELSSEWTISEEYSQSTTETWTRTLEWDIKVVIESDADSTTCVAEASRGNLDLEWTGTLNLIVDAGNGVQGRHWKGEARGRFSSIDVSQAHASCGPLRESTKREHIGSPAARARQTLTDSVTV